MSDESPDVALPYGMAPRIKARLRGMNPDDPETFTTLMSEIQDRIVEQPPPKGSSANPTKITIQGIPSAVFNDPGMNDLISRYFLEKWRDYFFPAVPETEPTEYQSMFPSTSSTPRKRASARGSSLDDVKTRWGRMPRRQATTAAV